MPDASEAPHVVKIRALHSGLRVIAATEFAKGVLVLIAAGLIVRFVDSDVQALAEALVARFHLNPARHDPQVFVSTLRDFADAHKLVLSLGAACYALVRFIEAYGLWHARAWAWGFGILSGALYIPFELVELVKHVTWPAVTMLVANVLVVLVLWASRRATA
jgi:uncharacterized membrane protein (DUF2068 family)